MDLPFLQGIAESRLFQGEHHFKSRTVEQLAELVMLMILVLEILRHVAPRAAADYADRTMRFMEFNKLRIDGTDLHNLIVVLTNQKNYEHIIQPNHSISIPFFQLKQYFREMGSGQKMSMHDEYFIIRLEDYLRVSNHKPMRRVITTWDSETESTKYNTLSRLRHEFSNKGYQLDLWTEHHARLSV